MPALHPLSNAIATVLPSSSQTQLLRGCIDSADSGRQALSSWFAQQSDPTAVLTRASMKWLLPLVLHACEHHGSAPISALLTILKAARLREELRVTSYRSIRRRVLQALGAADVPVVVLKGAALGELVYPDAALRHAHDLELLVRRSDWERVAGALAPLEFTGLSSLYGSARAHLTHASGLPVVIHRHLHRIPFYNGAGDDPHARAEAATLGGACAHVLSPADAVAHICVEAFHSASWQSHRWAVDCCLLLQHRPDIDWDVLTRIARGRRMALPLSLCLCYLAEQLGARVPVRIREELAAVAASDRSLGPELALHGARTAAGGLVALVHRAPTMRDRAAIARRVLVPSLTFLSWATQPRSPKLRVVHRELFRVARYVGRRAFGIATSDNPLPGESPQR